MNNLSFASDFLEKTEKPSLASINKKIKRVRSLKKQAIRHSDEELSNHAWIVEHSLIATKLYIKTFYKLKAGDFYEAWCDLEKIEILLSRISENNKELCLEKVGLNKIKKMVSNWQSIYPYDLFISPGFISKYKTCSICRSKVSLRKSCGHKKGKLYNGSMCFHTVHKLKYLEVSIVENPVQKYSVLNHEGKDYSQLKYILDQLHTPYDTWSRHLTKKSFPRDKFKNISKNDKCPCQSGLDFYYCCQNKKEIVIPHVQIEFHQPVRDKLLQDFFPY